MEIVDFIQDNTWVVVTIVCIIVAIVLYFVIRTILYRKIRNEIFSCVDFFVRNCHETSFYDFLTHRSFVEYESLFQKAKKSRGAWYLGSKGKSLVESFLIWYDSINSFVNNVSSFMPSNHYFAHSEFLYCMKGVDFVNSTSSFLTMDFLKYVNKKIPESLVSIDKYKQELQRGFSDIPNRHNKVFIDEELKKNKEYFDTVLSYPLDPQQRESIVKLEDNCLVVSSAGSGKTSTSVGKIKYLVEKKGIKPSKILPLTYTTKAASELSERLDLSSEGLVCHTFHSLAFRILAETTKEKPSICEKNTMMKCFYHLVGMNEDFKKAVNAFITSKSSLTKREHEYITADAYYIDRAMYGIQAPFLDMDGRIIFTKSEEEKRICTFLSLNGVDFRYEEPYAYNTAEEFHRQYRPDFTIHFNSGGRHYYLILEHFSIDENGNVPQWFGVGHEDGFYGANREYNEGIAWKRSIHRRYGTALIETTSAMFQNGTIYDRLLEQLRQYNVPMHQLTEEEKFEKLVKRNKKMEDSILQLMTTFITLMKSNRTTPEEILETIKKDKPRHPAFIERSRFMIYEIFMPMYEEYESYLRENKQIDYTDLILKATDICNAGQYHKEYDMILVDEFQDISIDRFKLLQSLRRVFPLTKLYCVGDDWQSIFRFSGSDLSLFNSFEEYFGFTERCKIETTYRFGDPTISLSSNFILKNPAQVIKEIRPFRNTVKTVVSLEKYGKEEQDQYNKLVSIVSSISRSESVMLIGRYHSDTDFIKRENVSARDSNGHVSKVKIAGREISFNTIHSAKGLEADNIILVNCSQDGNGFPSKISDDPILGYVLSKPEAYPFSEERRLFYVAITRAKKHTYVMYKETCPSAFVSEIGEVLRHNEPLPNNMECPWCKNGILRGVWEKNYQGGVTYRLYRCTNYTAGCQYKWMVRFNDESSVVNQFRRVKRESVQYITPDQLDQLSLENPNARCKVVHSSRKLPWQLPNNNIPQ